MLLWAMTSLLNALAILCQLQVRKSGAVISAMSRSSNKDSCSGPLSSASFLIAGARSAVT
jgi:hypothetical protein